MVTASNSPFDTCRANAAAALTMLTQGQQWREQLLKLQQRRLDCERAALEGTLDTLRHAQDWTDLATQSQAVLRDYLSTSTAIWQESVTVAMQDAGAWAETARGLARNWQESLARMQASSPATSAMPMRDWMTAFERAVGAAVADSAAAEANAAGVAASEAAATDAAAQRARKAAAQVQGERHG